MDLGVDLDRFDDDEPEPEPADELPRLADLELAGRGRLTPLADLQREGFNTTPPISWQIRQSLNTINKQFFAGIGEAFESFTDFGAALTDTAEAMKSLITEFEEHDEHND